MNSLLYPNPNRSIDLLREIADILCSLVYVRRVMIFGSCVRNEYDRWSDIDMIVVTDSSQDFEPVYKTLHQQKAIIHHNPLTLRVEPCGGHLLGVVFKDESVFHNLDLNFLSVTDYQTPDALQRFEPMKDLYVADKSTFRQLSDEGIIQPLPSENLDEIRIGNALHWTKKAIKRVLRQQGVLDDVKTHSDALKRVMDDYPADVVLPNGNISRIARAYIEIADQLLTSDKD